MEQGNLDKKYCMKVIRNAYCQREQLQRDERKHYRLTKTQTINGAACLNTEGPNSSCSKITVDMKMRISYVTQEITKELTISGIHSSS